MECKNTAYLTFAKARKIPYEIVEKLVNDCPELWKLMKYENPVGKPDLTKEEISSMICPDSMNIDKYNVIFQKMSQQAVADETGKIFAQMRLQVLNSQSLNASTSRLFIVVEFVVNEKKMVCSTDYTIYDNRAFAMLQSFLSAINGQKLSEDNTVFLNGTQTASANFQLVNYNNEFSGYQVVMASNITG